MSGDKVKALVLGAIFALGLTAATQAAPPAADGDASDRLDLPLEGAHTAAVVNVPTNDQMQREYPRVALAMSLPGSATMTCASEPDGHLDECRVDSESPAGLGFGAAVLRLAAYFSIKPATFDGHPVKSQITIPIRFQMGEAQKLPDAPSIPPPTSPAALVLAREVLTLDGDGDRLRAVSEPFLAQLNIQMVAGGDAAAGERFADAYRLGLQDAIADELDQRARLLAATMTADQLGVTRDYLKTPAGAAYRQALARIEDPRA
jgi:TonB family protein